MIVYVESNFILELAYLQEDHEACDEILRLAEQQSVNLVLPAFCVGEPYGAWVGRDKRRARLHDDLTRELKELARSQPYTASRDEFLDITKALAVSGGEEKRRLDRVALRVLKASTLIPIDHAVLEAAIDLQTSRDLEPQDSIVYASVLAHLTASDATLSCFITKNSKDFSNPDIESDLAQNQCALFTSFGQGYGFLLRTLKDG